MAAFLSIMSSSVTFAQGADEIANLNQRLRRLYDQGKYAEAIPFAEKRLSLQEKTLSADHLDVGTALHGLALLYWRQGRYAEAEPLFKRGLAINEKALGPDHPDVGTSLNSLGELYRTQGRYTEAEPLYKRALALRETVLGPDHPDVGTSLNNLAGLYRALGRDPEAEPLYKRALTLREKALGADHPDVGTTLGNLALLYATQLRYREAEPLYKRALAIREKVLGPDHPDVGTTLISLGQLYVAQVGRNPEAEPLYRRGLAINEKALGPDHPWVGAALINLSWLYSAQGRYAEAEPLTKRALAINEKAFGPDHPDVGHPLLTLGNLYLAQGRYVEAEPLYRRALQLYEKALGSDHPYVGATLNKLANLYMQQSDWARAAVRFRNGTDVLIRRARRGTGDSDALTSRQISEVAQSSGAFQNLVKVAHQLAMLESRDPSGLGNETFVAAQWARSSVTATSLAQMAMRGATGDARLASLVRERQDLVVEWQKRDRELIQELSQASDKRDRAAETINVARLSAIDDRLSAIDKRLAAEFPGYATLTRAPPLNIEQVQALLKADEVLVTYLNTPATKPLPAEAFVWVISKASSRWVRLQTESAKIFGNVFFLRCGLDPLTWQNPDGAVAKRCREGLKVGPQGDTLPFALGTAHVLYKALFGQIEAEIKGKQLLVVADGALTGLPFGVLVTEPIGNGVNVPDNPAAYRNAKWLGARQPITMLPSVASLQALRKYGKQIEAPKPFIGFGNPLLDGIGASDRSAQMSPAEQTAISAEAKLAREKQSCGATRTPQVASLRRIRNAVTPLGQSGLANLADLRRQSPLPETADELCRVAKSLGVGDSEIYLGARATEKTVKSLSASGQLAQYRVVHFATHGAVAGDIKGRAEPGLILTPPEKATEEDDGYLSASEVAALKLNADWVILSACNTAAGGVEGAEQLSGLARAFFYAGARSMLVSHWAVESSAAVKLTTKAFAEMKASPSIGRAEAMRRSMSALIQSSSALEAHPSYWAPFVVVGDGAR